MDDARLLRLLGVAAEAIEEALMLLSPSDRERRGDGHDDQFEFDVLADRTAVDVLVAGGVGVLSEESGVHRPERAIRVVLDPIDGSTNCSRGLDPYGPSICAFDSDGPRAGLVVNLASGRRYTALRGVGAWCDDSELVVRERPRIGVVATGDPIPALQPQAWTRISGASAHDLCRVADGTFDGYADERNTVSIWDYASAALILLEAGGAVVERDGRDLFDLSEPTGYRLLAASSPAQIDNLRSVLSLNEPVAFVGQDLRECPVSWSEFGPPALLRQATDFHQYAYGVLGAVKLAAALGLPDVSLLELGVAGGNGLLELERLATEVEREHSVASRVVGFDLGTGMPPPLDHRDVPYAWREGFFRMDEALLRSRLGRADLVLGEISRTGLDFLATLPPPIGFISFDLDYYSSTVAAFGALLESDDLDRYLPRVLCYFDDTVGPHAEMHSEHTGELLAINEFNERHQRRKLARINGLRYKVMPCDGPWVEGMFVLHLFDHPRYDEYVFPALDRQFPLVGGA